MTNNSKGQSSISNYVPIYLSLGVTALAIAFSTTPVVALNAETCASLNSPDATSVTIVEKVWLASTGGLPEHCQVTGEISPSSSTGYPIKFQVGMPTDWNGRTIHGGGGGLNGRIPSPVKGPNWAPEGAPLPMASGYATYASDSGHDQEELNFPPEFFLNAEALSNFGFAALKRTHDVSEKIVEQFYGQASQATYFIGFSEGGREALEVAQRYPDDYAGVIAGDPVQNLSMQWISHFSVTRRFYEKGGVAWITPEDQQLVGNYVLAKCDSLDGLVDGIIANTFSCNPDLVPLLCEPDTNEGCLTQAKIDALIGMTSPIELEFDLANGVSQIAGKPWGSELIRDGGYYRAQFLGDHPFVPGAKNESVPWEYIFASGAVPLLWIRNQEFDFHTWDWNDPSTRWALETVSPIIDSTKSDLSDFHRKGGKIIMYAGGASDVPPGETANYYERLVATMGQETVDEFVRFYVFPGTTHGGETLPGTPRAADLMGAFETWVREATAPEHLINMPKAGDDQGVPILPLCHYPAYPRYKGSGGVNELSSYECLEN